MSIQHDLFGRVLSVPETEGIKYTGSKLKILPYIIDMVGELRVNTALDAFSGTTRVAQAFSQIGYDTTANDISVWSEVFGTCYLLSKKPDEFYLPYLEELNALSERLDVVVCDSETQRADVQADAKALFEWAYSHFNFKTLLSDSTELGQVTVKNGSNSDYVLVKPISSFGMLWYDLADVNSITQEIDLRKTVSAPVKKGDILGTVTLKFSGEEISTVDLVATSNVELSKLKYYMALIKYFPKTDWLTRAILFSILLCAVYIALCLYSHIQYLKRRQPVTPVHLKPNSAAVKREARKSEYRSKEP